MWKYIRTLFSLLLSIFYLWWRRKIYLLITKVIDYQQMEKNDPIFYNFPSFQMRLLFLPHNFSAILAISLNTSIVLPIRQVNLAQIEFVWGKKHFGNYDIPIEWYLEIWGILYSTCLSSGILLISPITPTESSGGTYE